MLSPWHFDAVGPRGSTSQPSRIPTSREGGAHSICRAAQLAWRFFRFQKDSALARWYHERTTGGRSDVRKTMIVALARKLLIALWRFVTQGAVPEGVVLKPAA